MIATGTGISPFHSMIHSRCDCEYTLLHGVRTEQENYDWRSYPSYRLVRCISQPLSPPAGDFRGRVTEYLRQHPVEDPSVYCFLCGNCDMIYEAFDILQSQGVPTRQLFAEVYF